LFRNLKRERNAIFCGLAQPGVAKFALSVGSALAASHACAKMDEKKLEKKDEKKDGVKNDAKK
jgi:hypothetical protein